MHPPKIKVLIIGCGNIAGRFDMDREGGGSPITHAAALSAHPGFEILACIDPHYDRLMSFASFYKVPKWALSITSLDAAPEDFDLIVICSPTDFHSEHVIQSIYLKPRAILAEKPLTNDFKETLKLVKLCEFNKIPLIINYTRRWDPEVLRITAQIKSGHWGEVRSAIGFYNKGILNNGGHLLDIFISIFGPMEIISSFIAANDNGPKDPTVAAVLRQRDGDIPIFLVPGNSSDYSFFEIEFICQKGTLRMSNGGMAWEARSVESSREFKGYRTLSNPDRRAGSYQESMSALVHSIYSFFHTGLGDFAPDSHVLEIQSLSQDLIRFQSEPF